MNYGELQSLFKLRLNRRDITQSLVESFIGGAIQRTQRLLRTPGSEVATEITFGPDDITVAIPGDYLQMVGMYVDGGPELSRVNLSEAMSLSKTPGTPQVYARNRNQFVVGPRPAESSVVSIVYLANFASLDALTDSNWLTEIASDVILDGAMSKACQHFSDPRQASYEDSYVTAIVDMNTQAQNDELINGQVASSYSMDFGASEL